MKIILTCNAPFRDWGLLKIEVLIFWEISGGIKIMIDLVFF